MIRVFCDGRIATDLELKKVQGSNGPFSSIRFRIASDRTHRDANGEKIVDFVTVRVTGKKAETLAQYKSKGDLLNIDGTWKTHKYTNKQGLPVIENFIEAESITFVGKKESQNNQQHDNQYQNAQQQQGQRGNRQGNRQAQGNNNRQQYQKNTRGYNQQTQKNRGNNNNNNRQGRQNQNYNQQYGRNNFQQDENFDYEDQNFDGNNNFNENNNMNGDNNYISDDNYDQDLQFAGQGGFSQSDFEPIDDGDIPF